MSRRIFVNILNETYTAITSNRKGNVAGLGVTSPLTPAEASELGKRGNEIYFTRQDLLEKKRKIQVVYDSFTDPKFFGDGSVNVEKVQKYLDELELQAEQVGQVGIPEDLTVLSAGVGVITSKVNLARLGFIAAKGAGLGTGTSIKLASQLAIKGILTPGLGIAVAAGVIANSIKDNRQAGREDNAAPWKMVNSDFPKLTGQARADGNKRSIERLYDNRQLIGGRNRSTKYAIARLVREALGDALFSRVPEGGTVSLAVPEHPVNEDKEALAQPRHFPFRDVTEGTDQTERTYVNAVLYLKSYINLIDAIINLQDPSLSRAVDTDITEKSIQIEIKLSTALVPLYTVLENTAKQVIREKVLTFFDKNREYKTLLNFGNDRQYLAEAWRLAPSDSGSLQLKLLRPLEEDITPNTTAFISREIAETVVDTVTFELSPALDTTPYLRPFNINSRNQVASRMVATNTTLDSLQIATGAAGETVNGTISYGDTLFRRWFNGDYKSSELNIDFTNYANFVHFGSAYKRLEAFSQKLYKIEQLTSASEGSANVAAMLKAREKESIYRAFDPYEQFLYYTTGSVPYSASAYYADGEVEYNATAYWPKQADGTPYSPLSSQANAWFALQSNIALRFDQNNPNYLVTNLPTHIQEDEQSEDYTTFFAMVGHILDNIKVYIDQFPYIYSTQIDPLKNLTMDQVYEVAQSFGMELPNIYAVENLQGMIGDTGSRAAAAETWKRFLHSMVYLYKTKGSRTSFDALLNTYGINSPVLQIKETTYPSDGNYIQSQELTYGLEFTSSIANKISVPLVSSSLSGSTFQISFNPGARQSSSLLTGNGWALDLIPHPSQSKLEYGRIHIVSGSNRTIIASSSYFPLFSDDYTNLMLRSQSADFTIVQTDGDQILFRESASVAWGTLWNATTTVTIGGTGSIKLGSNFDGVVDEIRVWGENISNNNFLSQSYDPGSFYASSTLSAYNNLYVHVPFSQPLTSITASVLNESPYQNVSIVSTLPAVGFTTGSYTRILRNIKQFVMGVGATTYTNRKVNVAPPPVFNPQSVDGNGTRILSIKESIKRVEEKQYDSSLNVVSFAISPTDFINQNIIRSMGVVDANDFIGSPRFIEQDRYSYLDNIKNDYIAYYNKKINPNEYIRFFRDLVEGPGEAAETMVPARTQLLDGIVIESPVLSRNKTHTVKSFAVDGSNTKTFTRFVSGSGSIGVGAYDFSLGKSINILPTPLGDNDRIEATIQVSEILDFRESTPSTKLPPFRKVIQRLGTQNVTASIMDSNSAYESLEAHPIAATPLTDTVSSGYPRNPFVGIPASGSILKRLDSEDNTLTPFYDIEPRSDLNDVGTTTYFHKSNGIYSYDIYTLYKQPYLVKLDTKTDLPLTRLYAPITLLAPNTIIAEYGRNSTTIPVDTYQPGLNVFTQGIITVANIFTLYGISGANGLRVRFYRTKAQQDLDLGRSFLTPPDINSGVLFDAVLDGNQEVFPYVMIQTTDAFIYYTVTNETGSPIASSITLEYFAYEPDSLIPKGYLPRHYKYSRDNTTALKRRNYVGCREVGIEFDRRSPVVVTVTAENKVVVNNTSVSSAAGTGTVQIPENIDTIQLGGAGRLTVE